MNEDFPGKITMLSQQVVDLQTRVTELEEIVEAMLPILEAVGRAFRFDPRATVDLLRGSDASRT